MKLPITLIIFLVTCIFSSCSRKNEGVSIQLEKPTKSDIYNEWFTEDIIKVVGYRFKIPGENSQGKSPGGHYSLIHDSVIDFDSLNRLKVKRINLKPKQTKELVDLVFNDGDELTPVACYSPHHLFVFYDSAGVAKKAIEICFQCNGVRAIPKLPNRQHKKVDLMRLAKLCNELGIWGDYESIEDYAPIGTEEWRRKQKAQN